MVPQSGANLYNNIIGNFWRGQEHSLVLKTIPASKEFILREKVQLYNG